MSRPRALQQRPLPGPTIGRKRERGRERERERESERESARERARAREREFWLHTSDKDARDCDLGSLVFPDQVCLSVCLCVSVCVSVYVCVLADAGGCKLVGVISADEGFFLLRMDCFISRFKV